MCPGLVHPTHLKNNREATRLLSVACLRMGANIYGTRGTLGRDTQKQKDLVHGLSLPFSVLTEKPRVDQPRSTTLRGRRKGRCEVLLTPDLRLLQPAPAPDPLQLPAHTELLLQCLQRARAPSA